jgi:hypothetical protein
MFPSISPCHLALNVETTDIYVIMFKCFGLVIKDSVDWRGRQLQAEGGALSFATLLAVGYSYLWLQYGMSASSHPDCCILTCSYVYAYIDLMDQNQAPKGIIQLCQEL